MQTGIAAGPLLGEDADVVYWDSGMTERGAQAPDVLLSQAILGGQRSPLLMNGGSLSAFYNEVDADVANLNIDHKKAGIPETSSVEQAKELPWAAKYHSCSKEMKQFCDENKYRGECWIQRDDVSPPSDQSKAPGGRASWHPGDRVHQLRGRHIAFFFLKALKAALSQWAVAENFVLPDSAWHMDAHTQNIQNKLLSRDTPVGSCKVAGIPRACLVPMKGRTEFCPKARPWKTAIRSILKGDYGLRVEPNLYDPPEVFIPSLHVPEGAFEYLAVVENGVEFTANSISRIHLADEMRQWMNNETLVTSNQETEFVPGKGILTDFCAAPNLLDGSYDSFSRRKDSNCLFYNANDNRGGLKFDGLSGWIILNLEEMKNGIASLKIETWHAKNGNVATNGWECENGSTECKERSLRESNRSSTSQRQLKKGPPPYCDDFRFEFAIDRQRSSWNLTEWQSRVEKAQRVVELVTLLDDPDYTEGATKDVELAFRITGCARQKTMKLTHVYWS